jgi:2-dehydropantoate 2-reductase
MQRHGLSEHKFGFDINWQIEDGVWYSQQSHRQTWRTPLSASESDNGETAQSIRIDESPIEHLIVSTKAMQVVKSLMAVRHRLSPESTIVFLQNGMGVLEEVNKNVFPDPETRPSYITGIVSHGLYRSKHFNVIHKGVGTTILGVQYSNPQAEVPPSEGEEAPQEKPPKTESTTADESAEQERSGPSHIPPLRQIPLAPSASYLLRTFARASVLVPHITNSVDVQLFQLEKISANALINPLTVINDCTNGHLLGSDAITRVQRLLLYEISGVIGALPELQSVPGIKTRFAPERLLALSRQIIHKTARNTSSMLQDVSRGKTTEIDYINGYFVRRGEEVGIACALNYMLVNLVKGKAQIMERGKEAEIPLDTSEDPEV